MPALVHEDRHVSFLARTVVWSRRHLNFFRIHIIFYTLAPLIFSGILYASNGRYHISYIDSLFNSVSAMAVCGLATVDLSSLTGWQQALLLIQMCLGSPVLVSWVVVYVRRRMFRARCENIVLAAARKVAAENPAANVEIPVSWTSRLAAYLRRGRGSRLSTIQESKEEDGSNSPNKPGSAREVRNGSGSRKLRPDMIRRMDDAPQLVNPSGWISEGRSDPLKVVSIEPPQRQAPPAQNGQPRQLSFVDELVPESSQQSESSQSSASRSGKNRAPGTPGTPGSPRERRLSDPGRRSRSMSASPLERRMQRFETMGVASPRIGGDRPEGSPFPRTQTVEFAPAPRRNFRGPSERGRMDSNLSQMNFRRPTIDTMNGSDYQQGTIRRSAQMGGRTATQHTYRSAIARTKNTGFGGFPTPDEIVSSMVNRFLPKLQRQLSRTVTMPRTTTITSQAGSQMGSARPVPYISFDAVVGRNSVFHALSNEQLEELGGIEYRALSSLLWIVATYHILVQLIGFTIIGPYMSISRWQPDLNPPMQHRPIAPGWFSFFQIVSAYTNTGMSLVDQSMIPFQTAYPMIVVLIWQILAGNTGFPVFLRFFIWTLTKMVPRQSRVSETLHFLLDHPRRCFIYLFPSHQTWFLLIILIILNGTDWFFFLVLDLGNPVIDAIPPGVRVIDGFLQAAAVRSSGFAVVTLSALAPGVKVLYVIMMYISVYPIAMSVRSTNVYEEKSLGIYEDDDEESVEDDNFSVSGKRVTVWSRYLAMHARKQLSFDMWWLGLALFVICIIERDEINNPDNATWFTIWNIVFELVSAYGTVGLSLGVPFANYSFSGAFNPLSKLVVCAVMLRGRHRGLPVAIDRAVVLPFEYRKSPGDGNDDEDNEEMDVLRRRPSRRNSMPLSATSGHDVGGYPQNEKPERSPDANGRPSPRFGNGAENEGWS